MEVSWILAVDLVKSIAWPLVAVFAFFLFYEPLSKLMAEIAFRADKLSISIAGVSLELATLKEYSKSISKIPAEIPALIKTASIDESIEKLNEMISTPLRADYAIIDLGSGQEWLTTRLFLFALLSDTVTKLRAFVFVEQSGGTREKFLGVAAPSDTWKSLAIKYPWLDEAFHRAAGDCYKEITLEDKDGVQKFSNEKPIFASDDDKWRLKKFIRNFHQQVTRVTTPPDGEGEMHYKIEETPPTWEKGCLIDGDLLHGILKNSLDPLWCEESCYGPRSTIAEAIVQQKGAFISLVNPDRRFVGLVDRYELLDQIIRNR